MFTATMEAGAWRVGGVYDVNAPVDLTGLDANKQPERLMERDGHGIRRESSAKKAIFR